MFHETSGCVLTDRADVPKLSLDDTMQCSYGTIWLGSKFTAGAMDCVHSKCEVHGCDFCLCLNSVL